GNTGTTIEAGNLDNGTVVAGTPTASGTLASTDVDHLATATWSGPTTGTYGSFEIGRASCRERTLGLGGAGAVDKVESDTETMTGDKVATKNKPAYDTTT